MAPVGELAAEGVVFEVFYCMQLVDDDFHFFLQEVAQGNHPNNLVIIVFYGKMSNSVFSHYPDGMVERT